MNTSHGRDGKYLLADGAHRRNDAMRQHWNHAVCEEFNVPDYCQSVAVLLIRWADWLDRDLRCREETSELETVFREKFGFETHSVILDCGHKKPESQLHLAMSQFVSDYDGSHRTTLLIVYYRGHGLLQEENGVNQFYIGGRTRDAQLSGSGIHTVHEPFCRWGSVDTHLQDANADVLVIVDSSYAATDYDNDGGGKHMADMRNILGPTPGTSRSAGRTMRSIETLAATPDHIYPPGPWSFTRALIDSLSDLHSETVDVPRPFDTDCLHDHITCRMRDMPSRHHIPPLFIRDSAPNPRNICLAPLVKTVSQKTSRAVGVTAILHLQVAFAKTYELQENEITRLAQSFAQAAKNATLNIISLDWMGFEANEPKFQFYGPAVTFLRAWIRKTRARRRGRKHVRSDDRDDLKPPKRLRATSPLGPRTALTPRTGLSPPSSAASREATTENIESMVRQQFSDCGGVVHCTLAWELKSCVDTDLGGVLSLDNFLTITGHSSSAYATTCSEWIGRIWGDLGLSILSAIHGALTHGAFISEYFDIRLTESDVGIEYGKVVVKSMSVDSAVIVVQTLGWLAATFRPPIDGCLSSSSATVSLDSGRIYISLEALIEVEADPLTSCWQSLLGSSVIARGFYISDGGDGLELSLSLMLDLTGMLYGTSLSGSASSTSTFYTGIHSILYPTERNEAQGILRWHYASSDCVMTPPVDRSWPQVHQADLDSMRMILGYTPKVKVHLGTEGRSQQYLSMTASHAQREKDSWGFAWDGFTAQAGFAGSGISLPFKFTRRKGQQGVPTAKPTYDQIIHGTVEKPVILYETACAQETAWLVPQLSVILDLVLLQANGERSWEELSASDRAALHAQPDWNSGLAALAVLDDYQRANTTLRTSADDGRPIAIKHLVTQVFAAMSYRTQLDQLQPPSSSLITSLLLGWDLIQLTDALVIPTRLQTEVSKAGFNNSTPTWLPLAREVPVFFCDGLGDVMTSTVPTCSQFQRDQKHLVASIQVLRAKFKKCFKCDECHIDTKKQLVWQLPRSGCFSPCSHGAHPKEDAKAHFDAGIQLMVPASDYKCVKRKLPCPIIPDEGAVVFGAKRLKKNRPSFEKDDS